MEFLGIIIGQGETKMDEKELEAIKEWKPPTSVKGIQSFTRFVNFYRKFIPDFFNIVTPLNLLTHKGKPWAWTRLQQGPSNTSNISSPLHQSSESLT